jgi:thiol-disulfide isomerase/thioredoxin
MDVTKKSKAKKRNCEIWLRTLGIILFLAMASLAKTAFSQIEKGEPNSTICTTDSKDNEVISPEEIEKLKKEVKKFLSLNDSNQITRNSHIYFNIAAEIILYDELLDMTEQVVKKGIEVNTVENLRQTYPEMSKSEIGHQQKLEFGRLYSQYAWILWKKSQLENAFNTIKKAMSYISSPTPDDYLRLGIIEYDNGIKQQGWNHITKALMTDTIVEEQDPGYRKAINKVIKDKFGTEQDPTTFITKYRKQNAQTIPSIMLITLRNTKMNTHQYDGKVIFVNFFSPSCSSCRQEIPSLKNLYESFSPKDDVVFIFILNRPNLKQEAIALFEKSSIDKPVIAIIENGSAWDLISMEPSIWIVDRAGKIVFRHSGYKRGDELIYRRKLSSLIQN